MGEPVKFEAGMVVKWRSMSKRVHVVIYAGGRMLQCSSVDGDGTFMEYAQWFEPVSPAPRAGDTWTSGESVARVESDGAQLRIVSDGEPFVGDVVAVARKLWEGGYRFAKRVPHPLDGFMVHAPRGVAKGETVEVEMSLGAALSLAGHPWRGSAGQLSAFDGTWPVFTPSAEVDGGIHPTREGVERVIESLRAAEQKHADAGGAYSREYHGEFRAPLPHAGDVYEHADGTIAEIRERKWRPGLRTHVLRAAVTCPLLVEADEPAPLAAMLREHGHTRRDGKWRVYESYEDQRRMELEKAKAIVKAAVASGASVSEVVDAVQSVSKGRIAQIVREQAQKWIDRGVLTAEALNQVSVEESLLWFGAKQAIDDTRVDRDTGDDLRKLAEVHSVQELRAGMVVRREPCENLKRVAFGRFIDRYGTDVRIHWLGDSGPWHYASAEVGDFLRSGHWRIVELNVAPIASLAYAVAAIAQYRADRATSRQCVDAAVARLRGELFVCAIQAALVGVSERANLTPTEVAAAIAALRHWEARRPFGGVLRPEARASLSRSSADALRGALGYAPVWDTDLLFSTYERARSSR